MTERKPPDLNFTTWIDRQINEAAERGAFDNLPGAGKPLPKRTEEDAAQAWLRDYLRREGVSADELLPTPLKLRKETERLAETVQELPTEQEVRAVVADLNRRIVEWRRIPVGPPVHVPLVKTDEMVARWRAAQAARTAAGQSARQSASAAEPPQPPTSLSPRTSQPGRSARRRWWRRFARSR
jgi:hypothetical protein